MPDGFMPNEGIGAPLLRIVNPVGADHNPWRLVFWVNNFTPDKTVTLAALTQATWGGYTFVTLDPTQWTAPVVTDPAGQTNYGYALIDTVAGVIRWIQRFDPADIVALTLGAQVTLLPQMTLTSASCP